MRAQDVQALDVTESVNIARPDTKRPRSFRYPPGTAGEFRLQRLREMPSGPGMTTPEEAASVWRQMITSAPWYDPERECFVALLLSTRRRLQGFALVSLGLLDTCMAHPREVYRTAILQNAAAIIIAHNHPSGDPTPSEADIKVTRDLIRAGQLLRIELLDSIIVGRATTDQPRDYVSLRELGYFYA